MTNQIKSLFDSVVTELVMLALACCIVLIAQPTNSPAADLSIGAGIAAAAILICWLAWASYILMTRKTPREMPCAWRLAVEGCILILFIVWFITCSAPVFSWPWLIFILWKGPDTLGTYRSLRRQ